MSFVVLGAYAPESVAETEPAGQAQLPLLFNPVPAFVPPPQGTAGAMQLPLLFNPTVFVEPVVDPLLNFIDHSPDLLLAWLDHPFEGSEFVLHEPAAIAFTDAANSNFALTGLSTAGAYPDAPRSYPDVFYPDMASGIDSVEFIDHVPD